MFSLFKGNSSLGCNSTLTNSTITNTNIDMNGKTITTVGDPINSQDAATKNYVDSSISILGISIIVVNLSGTTQTLVDSSLSGDITVYIKNLITGGPSAIFNVTKSEASQQASITRTVSISGITTNERLLLTWSPNTGITLNKTDVNYDGLYKVKVMRNI